MSVETAQPYLTAEAYLEIERRAETKSEYFGGRMYAMSGASRAHNLISGNLFREISTQLRGGPCEAYINDMRVKVSATGLYTYPDVTVVCGGPAFEDAHVDTLLNPDVLVEVLSPSTEAYDRGVKFAHYQSVESLKEYVLVCQDRGRAEHYLRQGETWLLTVYTAPDAVLTLRSIGCDVPLREIYDRVYFNEPRGGGSSVPPHGAAR
jgi:Uma2 family endonuclease